MMSQGSLLKNSLLLGEAGLFVLVMLLADWMKPTHIMEGNYLLKVHWHKYLSLKTPSNSDTSNSPSQWRKTKMVVFEKYFLSLFSLSLSYWDLDFCNKTACLVPSSMEAVRPPIHHGHGTQNNVGLLLAAQGHFQTIFPPLEEKPLPSNSC